MSQHVKQLIGLFLMLYLLFIAGCTSAPLNRQTTSLTQRVSPIIRQTPRQLQLTSSAWESIPLPVTDMHLLSSTISPDDPAVIYACSSTSRTPGVAGSLALWGTHDAGQHWSALTFPAATGTGCSISLAPALPQRIVVLVNNVCGHQPSCRQSMMYVSSDSGDHWLPISLASVIPQGVAIQQSWTIVTARHLYLWCAYSTASKGPERSLLARSDDKGNSWNRIDSSFSVSGSFFFPPKIDQYEALLISIQPHSSSGLPTEASLWISHDAGNTWKKLSAVSFPADNLLFSSEPVGSVLPTAQTPLYALRAEQIPSNLYDLTVVQSTDAQQWSLLPPLPVPGTSMQHPGLLQALAVTGDGDLLAFGPDPRTGLPTSLSTLPDPILALWLWFWNPHMSTWQVLSVPLMYPMHEGCGLCWSASISNNQDHGTYLYVQSPDEPNGFFRVRLPSLLLLKH